MAKLIFKNINKTYPNGFHAIHNFNLEIDDGSFVVFVGPSGCGKSTILRMIAGLEEISSGELYISGKLVNELEPKDRDIAMVFQNYALYPHKNVYENMAFGLTIRKVDKELIHEKVTEAADVLGLTHLLDRKPAQLSGGQRQRVALGRAIVREPQVFLMDEPLSNLDSALRMKMRAEILKLHQDLGATTIYVTHDQTEAMTMGDKIVILDKGNIQQIGSPNDIYNNPANLFVASFIGNPSINLLEPEIVGDRLYLYGQEVLPNCKLSDFFDRKLVIGLRPENIKLVDGDNFQVELIENIGSRLDVHTYNKKDRIIASVESSSRIRNGDRISIEIREPEVLNLFDKDTGEKLIG